MRRARYAPVVVAVLALAACDHDTIKPDYRPVSMVPLGTRWIGPVTLIGDDQKFHIGDGACCAPRGRCAATRTTTPRS